MANITRIKAGESKEKTSPKNSTPEKNHQEKSATETTSHTQQTTVSTADKKLTKLEKAQQKYEKKQAKKQAKLEKKANKKPMTTKALDILLNKLNNLASDDDTKIKVLEQSIEHCWQTVYALKENDDGNIQNTNGYRQGIYSDTRKNKADDIGKTQGKKWNIQIEPIEVGENEDFSDVI